MADSYQIIGDQVIPYNYGVQERDTRLWRDATEMELEQQEVINHLEARVGRFEDKVECLEEQVVGLLDGDINEGIGSSLEVLGVYGYPKGRILPHSFSIKDKKTGQVGDYFYSYYE